MSQVALKKGYLKSGGVGNFDLAARKILKDYMDGKMKYFTPAPHTGEDEEMMGGDEFIADENEFIPMTS